MAKDLSNYRRSYKKKTLDIKDLEANPLHLFNRWFMEVDKAFPKLETNAMTLSTIGLDGYPRNRVVLLKELTDEGFVFYTNYKSQKGQSIEQNNKVSISFFWPEAERQVILKGKAEKVSAEKSHEYFRSRPRGSQLGALVSDQSKVIPNREYLDKKLAEAEQKYDGMDIPMPVDWGGYLVIPHELEFWQGRPSRLHDRIRYVKNQQNLWQLERLSP